MSLQTRAGDVDLLLEIPGLDSFEGLAARSVKKKIEGLAFRIASVDDLMSMKRAASRPQDLVHLAELERITGIAGED